MVKSYIICKITVSDSLILIHFAKKNKTKTKHQNTDIYILLYVVHMVFYAICSNRESGRKKGGGAEK